MPVVLLCLHSDGIDIGFVGDPNHQTTIAWGDTRNAVLADSLKIQQVLKEAFDALLVATHTVTAVIVEPPLLALHAKQGIADVLFGRFRVAAVGFIQQSVCCIAGHELTAGIVTDEVEKLVVPVYDYRELTPFIRSLDDANEAEAIDELMRKAPLDIRRPLRENVMECTRKETWMGASALLTRRSVWPLLTREKHGQGKKVWDSLFHMR